MKSAIVAALLLVITLAGCTSRGPDQVGPSATPQASLPPTPSASAPTPSGTPTPSTAPSAVPSSPTGGTLAIDKLAVVVTNDLRVRSQPRVADDSALLTPLMDDGHLVFVVAGPVRASGFDWYQVQPLVMTDDGDQAPFGWVAAAAKDGEPWLAPADVCPATPKRIADLSMAGLIGVACFGHRNLTMTARLAQPEATCGIDPGWTIEPDWLASTCPQPRFIVVDTDSTDDQLFSVLDPAAHIADLHPGVEVRDWLKVKVTGHYDHAKAATCHAVQTESQVEIDLTPAEVVLSCRGQFVITAISRA